MAAATDFLWSGVMIWLLGALGLRLLICVGPGTLSPRRIASLTVLKRSERSEDSPLKTMLTALGGTIGVGNTVGVAAAIRAGGPGAVFWMVVCSGLAMVIKYAETYLSCRCRDGRLGFGGPMHYMAGLLHSPAAAALFSLSTLAASLFVGNASQSELLCSSLESGFGIPKYIAAGVLAAGVAAVCAGGAKRVTRLCSAVIPAASLGFCLICAGLCISAHGRILPALKSIVTGAFDPACAAAGAGGWSLSKAISAGFSKGMFSNEAGMGSAPMAHTRSSQADPDTLGAWGVLEVFIDTTVICLLSALVILTRDVSGVEEAFASGLGSAGSIIFALCSCVFAFASISAWSLYARSALEWLGAGGIARGAFFAVFTAASFAGAFVPRASLLVWADAFNALMALPNVIALFILSKRLGRWVRESRSAPVPGSSISASNNPGRGPRNPDRPRP